MRPKIVRLLISSLAVVGIIAAVIVPTWFLKESISQPRFRDMIESKVGQFLKAKVQIKNIRLGRLNEIALTDLEIDPRDVQSLKYEIQVQKILFRYNIMQLLSRNLRSPNAVILKSPALKIKNSQFPYEAFRNLDIGSTGSDVSSVELHGGKLQVNFTGISEPLILESIEGRFQALGLGKVEVRLTGRAAGFLEGRVRVDGIIDSVRETHRLNLQLESMKFGKGISLPLEAIQGLVRWEDQSFFFEDLKTKIHGWEAQLNGTFVYQKGTPKIVLSLNSISKFYKFASDLEFDLAKEQLRVEIKSNRFHHQMQGGIHSDGLKWTSDSIRLNNEYTGKGVLDLERGDVKLDLSKAHQRISFYSNLKRSDIQIDLKLDHAKIYGMDLVTATTLRLIPQSFLGEEKLWRFQGRFQTQYFILEYTPFENFEGSFDIDAAGIKNITSSWGNAFIMTGSAVFSENPDAHLSIKVQDLSLNGLKKFGQKPLPRALGGIVSGKMKVSGALHKPQISGIFTIKDGLIGRLEYDRAQIQFDGNAPYLTLSDSKIMRGRTKFNLVGAVDLSSKNILESIAIQTMDHLVIWKGIQVNSDEQGGEIEISTKLSRKIPLALKAGYTTGEFAGNDKDQVQDEGYIATGPKFKF